MYSYGYSAVVRNVNINLSEDHGHVGLGTVSPVAATRIYCSVSLKALNS
jgi:hypothetical protein